MSKEPYEFDPNTEPNQVDALASALPVLPYAGTSGHSGTDTSRERAERADAGGARSVTAVRQHQTLSAVLTSGAWGVTVADLRNVKGWHHGVASGVLSNLHKENRIAMLERKRGRCHIYVDWAFVGEQTTIPHSSQRKAKGHVYTLQEIKNGTGFRSDAKFMEVE
jgi:hypothetical protein